MIQERFRFNLMGEKRVLSTMSHSVMTPNQNLRASFVSDGMSLFVILCV